MGTYRNYIIQISKKEVLCFIYFFACIFGVKIGGFIDLSVIANVCIIFLFALRGIYLFKFNKFLVFDIGLIFMYALLVSALSGSIEWLFVLKFVRVMICAIAIPIFIKFSNMDHERIIKILLYVLLLHAIVVILGAAFWTDLQSYFSPISGFDRLPYRWRATGFTNGYDFAGVLCDIGLFVNFNRKNRNHSFLYLIIFTTAGLLTTRMNMIVLEAEIILLLLTNKRIKRICRITMTGFLLTSILPVLGIFLYSTGNTDFGIVRLLLQNSYFKAVTDKIFRVYAYTDIAETAGRHYNFSGLSDLQMIFGAGKSAGLDPGYTQYIYQIGILGVGLALIFYLLIISECLHKFKKNMTMSIILFACALCVILSVKNSYLLARHVTEICLVTMLFLLIVKRVRFEKTYYIDR